MLIQIILIIVLLLALKLRKDPIDTFWTAKESTALKGFLILVIVVYHSSFEMEIHQGIMQVVDNYVSAIAVGLFSFLSSYGIEIKYQKDKAGFYKWLRVRY